ncbi:hypothetical protein DASC09_018270 [Saccharomycopsis crataegensis]|uniref:Major facilitator superfamily (MFS) profile domain-containing protein n=1 Tax=Saccharomycopsis crataegensis TaxID=43959 RepID=A0AAV5QIS1_9ASCO|nr:hypothetical protein DASC09_018270 [Saccharomycopsis crataegensis]
MESKESQISSSINASDIEKREQNIGFIDDSLKDKQVEQLAQDLGIDHKKLMWKIDLCVIPPLSLLYFLAFLDRVNISNAKVYGITKSLGLKGDQFNTCLTLFFVPYIFFEIFSNYALKTIKPHTWLSGCIFLFGCITIGMGFTKNFGGLAACRFLLGIFESGSFPAIFYILSTFYSSKESQRRFSAFFSCTCLAGGAGGAIAYKIKELDGRYGIHSWQWIFIVEGTFTAGLALLLYFIVPDFPENSRFLNEQERKFIKKKLEIYSSDSGFEIKNTLGDVARMFKDPIIWVTALAYFGLIVPAYGYAYFATSIISSMGYTGSAANERSIYPWICAFGYTNIISFASDYYKKRIHFTMVNAVVAIAGLAIVLGCQNNSEARYAGCFLSAIGLYSAMPLLICWTSLNYGGHLRKGTGTAFFVGFGNIGGIISTYIFLAEDSPRYVKGLSICIAFTVFSMVFMLAYFGVLYKSNKDKQTKEYQEKFLNLPPREQILSGDKNPSFKYLY